LLLDVNNIELPAYYFFFSAAEVVP